MRLEAKGWRYNRCERQFQLKCNDWVVWQLFIPVYLGALRYLCRQDWGCCLLAAPWFVRAALRSEEGWPGNKSLLLLLGSVLAWALLFWALLSLLPYQLWGLMTQLASTNSHIPNKQVIFLHLSPSFTLDHTYWSLFTSNTVAESSTCHLGCFTSPALDYSWLPTGALFQPENLKTKLSCGQLILNQPTGWFSFHPINISCSF